MHAQRNNLVKRFEVATLLDRFPDLSIHPSNPGELVVAGTIDFRTSHSSYGEFADSFAVELRIPSSFPRLLPAVRETGGRIGPKFHRMDDGTLCLGSAIRLRIVTSKEPTLLGFVNRCLLPYLVGFSVHERTGKMPFDELKHGVRGLLDDYRSILGVSDDSTCVGLLSLLRIKKRVANKKPCPCGSGKRVGRCHNLTLNALRLIAPRNWFALIFANLVSLGVLAPPDSRRS